MGLFTKKPEMPGTDKALPGRQEEIPVPETHFVNGHPMKGPFAEHLETALFGMGCFWGAERCFWERDGVLVTAAGYAAGLTPNPSYEEVCSGMTGHNEVVRVVYDPALVGYEDLLEIFWDSHDPTQGMRQGNDIGTQYRSGIYTCSDEQLALAEQSRTVFRQKLKAGGFEEITTEILPAPVFYFAEHYHQQYLAKVPNGYCGLGGTGIYYRD